MSVINTNITSMIGQSNLSKSQNALQTSMERLSSGLRINSAKDDAAGQAIANRFTAQITGLSQAQRNANDGISIAQTAEGSLNQINDNLQRIRELSVQAANGTNSQEDLTSIQDEINQRLDEINRISEETDFNGTRVLAEDTGLRIQVGANDGQTIDVGLRQINAQTLGLDGFNVDGSGETQNRAATISDLSAAGANITGTGPYTVTTNHDAAKLTDVIGQLNDGDTIAVTGGETYTFSAASGNFEYEVQSADYSSLASDHTPSAGSTKTGVYEYQDGNKANFTVDANGNISIGGEVAYLNDGGELSTNDASGAGSQATLTDLFGALGEDDGSGASVDRTNRSIQIDGTTYRGQDNTGDNVVFTSTATESEVLAAASGNETDVTLSSGLTNGSVNFGANGDATDAWVDNSGELTTVNTFDTTYNVNVDTGEVTVAGGNGTGKYAPEVGATAYINSDGQLTTAETSAGDRTENPLSALDAALSQVDSLRSELGAVQNRFEDAITNLQTNETNLSAARSRIEDADYAVEVANMTRAQILQQAGTSVLAQANQIPQNVLSLLG